MQFVSRCHDFSEFRRFQAGFALSRADFYFKARGDRLCSVVRRRVYYLNSHIPETSRSKTGFCENGRSERALLRMQVCCTHQLGSFVSKKNKKKEEDEFEICV